MDTEDTGVQWIQRIHADSGYRETVDTVCTQLKISEFSADPCKNSNIQIIIVDTDGEWRGFRRAVDTGKQ